MLRHRREQSIDCPLQCEYLQTAHEHEPRVKPDYDKLPNNEIDLGEGFADENEFLVVLLTQPLRNLLARKPAITDYDMREAFEALTKTWRTLQSGLVYEQTPTNPYAADVVETIAATVDSIRKRIAEADSDAELSDTRVLHVLIFLQRLEYSWNNGRRKSRAFLDLLTRGGQEETVEPEEPRIIL